MNILIIAHNQDDGSPYISFVHEQAKAYKELGNNVVVVSFEAIGKCYRNSGCKYKDIDGIKLYYIKFLSLSNYGEYRGLNSFSACIFGWKTIKKIITEEKINFIHAHTISFDGAIAVVLKRKYKLPTIVTSHGTDTFRAIEKAKKRTVRISESVDSITVVSSMLKRVLVEAGILNVKVILNGYVKRNIDISEKEKELFAQRKRHSIIQVGNLTKQKNIELTIWSFYYFHERINEATLTIVGDGPERMKMEKLVDELNISDAVKFKGVINNQNVLEEMAKHEIFLMPSVNEGFGIVYLEAMSQGCITIGTKGGGIEDVIIDGKNGYLVSPCIEDVVNVLLKADRELQSEIADNGRKTVAGLSWERNVKEYLELFEQICHQMSTTSS